MIGFFFSSSFLYITSDFMFRRSERISAVPTALSNVLVMFFNTSLKYFTLHGLNLTKKEVNVRTLTSFLE